MQSAIIALFVLSLSVTLSDANVAILLGQCDNFAVESSAGITFDGRLTTVSTGDIGVGLENPLGIRILVAVKGQC